MRVDLHLEHHPLTRETCPQRYRFHYETVPILIIGMTNYLKNRGFIGCDFLVANYILNDVGGDDNF